MPPKKRQSSGEAEERKGGPRTGRGSKKGGSKQAKGEPAQQEKDRSGKSAEDLMEDVETMARKAGVKMPADKHEKDEETLEALQHSRPKRYREYSKQAALQELKEKHEVGRPKGEGDPFALASKKHKTGRGAPPPEEERHKPPTRRKTRSGQDSAMSHVACEENRPLVDALYELAEFTMHGDALQKGLTYQKAAKSVRESPTPIKSKAEAQKLSGIGRSVGDKVQEFLESGTMGVLEEYRSGERGL